MHHPQPPKTRRFNCERQGHSKGATRLRLARRVSVAVCRRQTKDQCLEQGQPDSGHESRSRSYEQRVEGPRFQICRPDNLLCVHAGSWSGERPHHGLLSLCAISERRGTATRCPRSQIEPPLERPDVRPLLGDSQVTVPRSRTQCENSTIKSTLTASTPVRCGHHRAP